MLLLVIMKLMRNILVDLWSIVGGRQLDFGKIGIFGRHFATKMDKSLIFVILVRSLIRSHHN